MAFVNSVPLPAPLWLEESGLFQANSLRKLVRLWSRGTAGVLGLADMQVGITTPTSMNVTVAGGDLIGQSPDTRQGGYIVTVPPQGQTVTVPTSDPNNPRNDILAVQILDSDYQGSVLQGSVGILQGTPAATPTNPVIPTDGVYVPLGLIPVGKGVASISAVSDLRAYADRGMQGYPQTTAGFGPPATGRPGDTCVDGLGNAWMNIGPAGIAPGGWHPMSHKVRFARFSGASANVPFASIPQYFNHLSTKMWGRGPGAITFNDVVIRFNNDTGANYGADQLYATTTGQVVGGAPTTNGNAGLVAQLGGAPFNLHSAEISIPNYRDVISGGSGRVARGSSFHIEGWGNSNNIGPLTREVWWWNAAAITQINYVFSGTFTGVIDMYAEL